MELPSPGVWVRLGHSERTGGNPQLLVHYGTGGQGNCYAGGRYVYLAAHNPNASRGTSRPSSTYGIQGNPVRDPCPASRLVSSATVEMS